ncbi:MAG: hypothetical protein NWF00_01015 [Candidatus Bathyarchaeota archaeon]|nr:hypothetical protein [Candidatus Bathyarchaeota archaeon]
MHAKSKSAITKLQTILLIDILIVAAAAAGFFYVSSLPGPELSPAQIQLMDLQVTPVTGLVGQSVQVSVNVTNVGGEAGTYDVNLMLDGVQDQAQTVQIAPAETKLVNFTISGAGEGTHLVAIGNLEAAFTLTSTVSYSDLAINRTTAQIDEPIGITVKVTNKAPETGSYSLTLLINNAEVQTKTGQIAGEASESVLFEVTEQSEGTYQVKVAGLTGAFTITPSAAPPKPAEFQVSNLTVDPEVVESGETVTVTAEVTNVGEESGSYTAELTVNGQTKDTQTVQLSGGATSTVTFTVTEAAKGDYTVQIGGETGTFTVQGASTIKVTNLIVRPYEVWAGETVQITAKATNQGTETSSASIKLRIGTQAGTLETVDSKTLTLAPGEEGTVEFTVVAEPLPGGDSLTYLVDVNGMQGGFMVVKDGFHTFNVNISPRGDADFWLTLPDGTREMHTTFWTALLPEGQYSVEMPYQDPTGRVTFLQWDDGSTDLTRTVTLNDRLSITATYTGGSSCPSLYMWNGTQYLYVGEVSNHGWLGYTRYVNEDGSLVYWRNNPWDYLPLGQDYLEEVDGNFQLKLTQNWDEIFFIDAAYMLAIDHPVGTDVYSTMVEQYIDPEYMGQIYVVNQDPLEPVSATNEFVTVYNGTVVDAYNQADALDQISCKDGVITAGFNGKYSEDWDNQTWNRLTMDLGNLTGAEQIKLVVSAMVDWGPEESYTLWMDKFYSTQVPNFTEPTPTPFMEVKDENGNWVRVPESRQFPLPPDGIPRTFVVDLTGLFPTEDYSLRISNFWNVTFDYVGVDITPSQTATIQTLVNGQADLSQAFVPIASGSSGNFTRYGNVTELLMTEDNKFVIGKQGDSVAILFPTSDLAEPAPGMVRSYYFFIACWFKVQYANYGFGPGNDGFTVTPIPFHNMTGFPYPLDTESYPYDADHISYLEEYNTRTVMAVPQEP